MIDKRNIIPSPVRKRSVKGAIGSACSHNIGAVCLLGSAMQLFVIKQGADDFYLGLLSFVTFAGAPFLLLGIKLMRKYGKCKVHVLWSGLLPAVILLFLVPMPLLFKFTNIDPGGLLLAIVVLFFLRSVVDSVGAAPWFPILQDNVPSRVTGKFFGNFRAYWQFSVFVTTLMVAFFLGKQAPWWKFLIVFMIGELAFIFKTFATTRLAEKDSGQQDSSFKAVLVSMKQALVNKKIRTFMVYILLYNSAVFMPLPFQIKVLNDLGYSERFIVAANAMISLGAIFSLRFWGKLADKFGNRSVFSLSHVGILAVISAWILIGDNLFSAILVFCLYFMWSVFQSGNSIAQIRYMLNSIPNTDQANISAINLAISLSVALSSLLGGLYLKYTAGLRLASGAIDLNNYHTLFLLCSIIVVVPHLMRRKMRTGGEAATSTVFSIVTRPVLATLGSFVIFNNKDRKNKNSTDKNEQNTLDG